VDREAWLILRLVPEVGRMRFHRLIEAFGCPEEVLGKSAAALRAVPGMDRAASENIPRHGELVDVSREKELIEANGCRLLCLHDEDYPANLRNSFLPPPLLYIRGQLEEADRFAIAVVGSRMSSTYGRSATDRIVADLAASGIMIVSGMAAGIDSAAHRAAIRHGGRTVAVLANGLARCFPAANRGLMEEIAANGAVISEYPMEERPVKMNFPERNRIIAAMALGTVVAEAPSRSGALITAEMTLEENRSLYAIPADIGRKSAEGSNRLIQTGAARLAASGRDILEDLHGQLRGLLKEAMDDPEQAEALPAIELTPEESDILNLITEEPLSIDELMDRLAEKEITIGRLSTLLLGLEMKKAVRQLPGKVFASLV